MRVWVDLSNSPHVALFAAVVPFLEERGDEVVLTARDHRQTVELAERRWPRVIVVGGPSPPGRARKAVAITARARALARLAAEQRIDVALSHGSYAQIVAARLLRVPAVTMMDYEHQPANHLSFRLAQRVIVPEAFPEAALRRFGAEAKTLRYRGYKEELYLAGFVPRMDVRAELGVDPAAVLAVLRPPPDGALYHRGHNGRFDDVLRRVAETPGVTAVLLARAEAARWRDLLPRVVVPDGVVDGPSLVGVADLVIGGGGTMSREAALLGTPTYTVFAGSLAAVDASLIAEKKLFDLRRDGGVPRIERKPAVAAPAVAESRRDEILAVIERALESVA